MKPYRAAVYSVLNGQIFYDSVEVKVYDEKKKVGETVTLFILLSTQQETPIQENDCTDITRSAIDIEIIDVSEFEASKDRIDDISNDVSVAIMNNLTAPSGFQFQNLRRESSITQNLTITETNSILRKILKFTCQIVEQQ